MKQKKIIYFLAGISLICLLYLGLVILKKWHLKDPEKISLSTDSVLGILTKNKSGLTLNSGSPQHYLVKIKQDESSEQITAQLRGILAGNPLVITLEVGVSKSGQSDVNVLDNVIKGVYDKTFTALCTEFSGSKSPIYLRWNPEMEVPVKLYPWQYQSPKVYIEAFNHFAKICKQINPEIRIVWGSAGYPGCEEYWPGSDLVDYTSIIINGRSEAVATAFPVEKNPETVIRRKILRMRFMDKPILVFISGKSEKDLLSVKNQLTNAVSKINLEKDIIYSAFRNDPVNAGANARNKNKIITGVYDPKLLLTKSVFVNVEHIFIDLGSIQDDTFIKEFNAIMRRRHAAIVTVEPWRDHKVRKESNVLLNTINGVYDKEFTKLYNIISNADQTVYLRFAHEMEIPIHRYAWQSQDPVLYIRAFRHFMSLDKYEAANIKKIWGPAGDRGSIEFWPGNDVVDYISIAIYGLPDKNITDVNQQESFNEIYKRKSYRMEFISKPIFITEFGVKGPEQYQQKWMNDASATVNSHKEIHGVCYFNLADNPKVWGKIPPPDWSISKTTYEKFVRAIITF